MHFDKKQMIYFGTVEMPSATLKNGAVREVLDLPEW